MTINVLLQGALLDAPQARMSAKGAKFATGSLRVSLGESDYESLGFIAFRESAWRALLGCHKGQAIAVTGELQRNDYVDRKGEHHRGWNVVVDAVLALQKDSKTRSEEKPAATAPKPPLPSTGDPVRDLAAMEDDIPY